MESFFSLLQKNVLDRRRWMTRDQLAYEVVVWIEHTYDRRRRQPPSASSPPSSSSSP
jgi:putative transposase